jgi:Uncharacterized protein conserved in bacteria (DUF2334)
VETRSSLLREFGELASLFLLLLLPLHPVSAQVLDLKHERVLLINQVAPEWRLSGEDTGRFIQRLLRHFTPNTQLIDAENYQPDGLEPFTRVVYVGNDALNPPPMPILRDLVSTSKPILWFGFGVGHLLRGKEDHYGFGQSSWREVTQPITVSYQGNMYPTGLDGYNLVYAATATAHVWSFLRVGKDPIAIPFVLSGANLWYVNGLVGLQGYPDPNTDAATLVVADLLHEFFTTQIHRHQRAVIRFEDVSTHVTESQISRLTQHLVDRRMPFAIGVIPNQRRQDGTIDPLGEHPQLVRALQKAQANGGAIVLHGYYHTFGTGEDYEFWDPVHNRPLQGDHYEVYACKVVSGIRILRDLGLEPRFWETPHYAGSPTAYKAFAHYFSHALENRNDESWLPYPYGPDQYGQIVIPEALGYIAADEGWTVQRQLARARLLRIVRDSWAVGFVHPATVSVEELNALVVGLEELGFEFADLSKLPTRVQLKYVPSHYAAVATWVSVHLRINVRRLHRWVRASWTKIVTTFGYGEKRSDDEIKVPLHTGNGVLNCATVLSDK